MPLELEPDEIAARVAQLGASHAELHNIVGQYFVAFGRAEHQLTRNLAHILDFRDFEKFDFLARGTPLHKKCDLLKRAAKDRGLLGEKIKARIDYFNNECRNLRNDLAHSDIELIGSDVYFLGISSTTHGEPDDVRPTGGKVRAFSLAQIGWQILWLHDFAADLNECAENTWNGREMEVASPRSRLPT